nr:hypothetical protein [Tanacetum cinerariifolium]
AYGAGFLWERVGKVVGSVGNGGEVGKKVLQVWRENRVMNSRFKRGGRGQGYSFGIFTPLVPVVNRDFLC